MTCDLDGCTRIIHPDYSVKYEGRQFCCEAHKAQYQRLQLQLLKQMHNYNGD